MSITARIYKVLPLFIVPLAAFCAVKLSYLGLEYYIADQMKKGAVGISQVATDSGKDASDSQQKSFDYQVILTRNLFGPLPEQKSAASEYGVNLEVTDLEIVLMGTVQGRENRNRAIILDKSSHTQNLYGVGDEIQGAKIKDIQRGKVIIAFDGRFEMLDMSEAAEMRKSSRARKIKSSVKGRTGRVKRPLKTAQQRQVEQAELQKLELEDMNIPPELTAEEGEEVIDDTERRLVRPRVIQPSRRIVPREE